VFAAAARRGARDRRECGRLPLVRVDVARPCVARFRSRDLRPRPLGGHLAGCWLLTAGCRLPAAGCWLLAAGCWLLAAGCWLLLAAGCWLLAAGCWLLAAGCWLPAAGCWLPAAGCWLLAASCWLLVRCEPEADGSRLAILPAGLLAWGDNSHGQLGSDRTDGFVYSLLQVRRSRLDSARLDLTCSRLRVLAAAGHPRPALALTWPSPPAGVSRPRGCRRRTATR
jgi:hypothetical protein